MRGTLRVNFKTFYGYRQVIILPVKVIYLV